MKFLSLPLTIQRLLTSPSSNQQILRKVSNDSGIELKVLDAQDIHTR